MNNILKNIIGVFLLQVLLYSCQKEQVQYQAGDSPNVRNAAYIAEVKKILTTADRGWMGYLYSKKNSAYTFYFDFLDENRVSMYSDFSTHAIENAKESSYSIKNTGTPALIFDSFNYIHILADPDNSLNGGTRGDGLYTDFEFNILEVSEDRIVLQGTFNENRLVLQRATVQELTALTNKTFVGLNEQVQQYALTHPFLFVSPEEAPAPISFTLNLAERSIQFSFREGAVLKEQKMGLATGFSSLILEKTFTIGDYSIQAIKFENGSLIGLDAQAKEFPIRVASNPIETLYQRLKDQRYSAIRLLKNNQVGDFSSFYNTVHSNVLAGGRTINYMEFKVKSEDTVTVNYNYTSSREFNAYYDYKLVLEQDEARFELLHIQGAGGAYGNYTSGIATRAAAMHNFLLQNTFSLDYYTEIINGAIQTLARFRSQEDPNNYMLFIIN